MSADEPHQLTTDSGALIYLYNQSLAADIAKALLANKVGATMRRSLYSYVFYMPWIGVAQGV